MTELLAPAGDMKALIAAISNGADAVYLGLNKFGARAYAKNFDYDSLKEAVTYAHLRNVKVYVAMNTVIFENELHEAYEQIDILNTLNVDGIIIQDLSLLRYIAHKYPSIEPHISTQVGIDDLHGVNTMEKLGAKRVVLARECSIEEVRHIKKNSTMSIEIFVHGALCVSYSGNCLMSGLIGFRSGNRGRCVGNCRKPYTLIDETNNIIYDKNYSLSMKDLNTLKYIEDIKVADSLKIEGRMKEANYVANVIKSYKEALDNSNFNNELLNSNLEKTFHRTFTKGYLFNEDIKKVSNISKPNNFGYYIGYVSNRLKDKYEITLIKPLRQQDNIRIEANEEVNLKVTKIYDKSDNLINSSEKVAYLKMREKLNINDKVYITSDTSFLKALEKTYPCEFKKFPLEIMINGKINSPLSISVVCHDFKTNFKSNFLLQEAINKPTTYEVIHKQLDKLNDSVYFLKNLNINIDGHYFIVIKDLNEIRRQCVALIDSLRLKRNYIINHEPLTYLPLATKTPDINIACYCNTKEQYNACVESGIFTIYYKDNIIRRNKPPYNNAKGEILVGGYGSLDYYKNHNNLVTDFSFNVTNSESLYTLFNQGVKRVTLSHELNKKQIQDMITSYKKKTKSLPNLEMIIYGRADLMFTKYCPLKKQDMCPQCKKANFSLKDDFATFPMMFTNDCHMTLLNSKVLNLIDDIHQLPHISTFRLQFTTESKEEVKKIIKKINDKLNNKLTHKTFDEKSHTRGHFNKEIL